MVIRAEVRRAALVATCLCSNGGHQVDSFIVQVTKLPLITRQVKALTRTRGKEKPQDLLGVYWLCTLTHFSPLPLRLHPSPRSPSLSCPADFVRPPFSRAQIFLACYISCDSFPLSCSKAMPPTLNFLPPLPLVHWPLSLPIFFPFTLHRTIMPCFFFLLVVSSLVAIPLPFPFRLLAFLLLFSPLPSFLPLTSSFFIFFFVYIAYMHPLSSPATYPCSFPSSSPPSLLVFNAVQCPFPLRCPSQFLLLL